MNELEKLLVKIV